MMCAFVFMARQIPPAPLFQRGVILTALYEAGSPFVKGGQGDLSHPYPEWPKR